MRPGLPHGLLPLEAPPHHLPLSYLLQRLHLAEVPPAQSDPASPPVSVIHLLNRDPVFGLSVWGYGDAVLPA